MPAEVSKSSVPSNSADLNAVIGLGAILFLFLLALGYICRSQIRRRERDVEQQHSGREARTSHLVRVAGVGTLWNSTDVSSSPGRSRADSAALNTLERAADSRSQVRAWEQQTVEASPPLYSNHRRQDNVHSIDEKMVIRQSSLSRTQHGRRCCMGAGTRGGSAARRHHSTLATILEPEAALQAVSVDQSFLHDREEAVRG